LKIISQPINLQENGEEYDENGE